jgi:hypothetical protein
MRTGSPRTSAEADAGLWVDHDRIAVHDAVRSRAARVVIAW